jgi:hypothetical protein
MVKAKSELSLFFIMRYAMTTYRELEAECHVFFSLTTGHAERLISLSDHFTLGERALLHPTIKYQIQPTMKT